MVKLEANFTPIQNLNGYEAPWPPGGGKNKLPLTLTEIKALNTTGTWSNNVYVLKGITFTVHTDDGGNVADVTASGTASNHVSFVLATNVTVGQDSILNGCPSGGNYSSGYSLWAVISSPYLEKVDTGSGISIGTGTYSFVRILVRSGYAISNTITFKPMIRLASVSDATFAPYSNICPISGHTGCEINRTGKNLCNPADFVQGTINSGTGVVQPSAARIASDFIPVKPSVKYCLITDSNKYVYEVAAYKSDKSFIRVFANVNASSGVITAPSDCGFIRFSIRKPDNSNITPSDITQAGAIESNEIVPYEAYSGTTVAISFGQTVYGGKLTVFEDGSGQVVADMALVDLGTLSWLKVSSNYKSFQGSLAGIKYGYNLTTVMSSSYVATNGHDASASADCYIWADGSNTVAIKDNSKSEMSASDFKTAMSGVQLCYELASPVTIPLTASQINTLVGENVVWVEGSSGNITVQAFGSPID